MIEAAVQALAKRISAVATKRLGEDHQCIFSMTSEPSRETGPVKRKTASQNTSFLTDLNVNKVTGGENRRDRRLSIAGRDDIDYEVWNLVPTEVVLSWQIPLYKGQESLFKFLPLIMSLDNGDLNFQIKVKIGDDTKAFPVTVQWDSDNITQPDLEGDVNTESTPKLEVPMKLLNVFTILSKVKEASFKTATVDFIVGSNISDPDDPSWHKSQLQI